jgi:hypothetical protein
MILACNKPDCDRTGVAYIRPNQVDAVKEIVLPSGWESRVDRVPALVGLGSFEDVVVFFCPDHK